MRIRASVAVVSGAQALPALAVPAARADGSQGGTRITEVVVDGGNRVRIGTSGAVRIDPRTDHLSDKSAGTWYVDAWINANDDDYLWKEKAGSFFFQRAARLTADAAPEPVEKGGTITVTGALSRADRESPAYAGDGSQSVKLRFRKKNATGYTTVKTVKADSKGSLKTTVEARPTATTATPSGATPAPPR